MRHDWNWKKELWRAVLFFGGLALGCLIILYGKITG